VGGSQSASVIRQGRFIAACVVDVGRFMIDRYRHALTRALFGVALALMAAVPAARAQHAATPSAPEKSALSITKGSLSFLVVGDWGRYGEPSQRAVAAQMAHAAERLDAKFFISTGDNFYPNGVASVDDPQWQQSFEQVYTDYALHNDWYVVLGNHDYRGNPQAEIDYTQRSRRWHMPARYYTVTKSLGDSTTAQFFFIDTSPFIVEYQKQPEQYDIAGQNTQDQLRWLEDELAKSKAKWKIVVGHHHIYSGGKRPTQKELEQTIVPLMERYGAQVYLCGHEHDLQIIRHAGGRTTYLVSGTGSEYRPTGKTDGTLFSLSANGFLAFSLTPDSLLTQVIDDSGEVRYTTSITR
jgi:tartrate-resistant acid phosphatase type 5